MILQGDCLTLMKQIPDGSVDMILADLPYGTTQCKWDVVIPFEPLWEQYERIIKNNGAIVLFGAEPFSSYLRLSNIKLYKYDWVWDKIKGTGFLNANKQPMRNHELISVFYKSQCTYNPQKTKDHARKVSSAHHKRNSTKTQIYGDHELVGYDSTERYPRSILKFSTDTQSSSIHPTQKPVDLCRYLIRTYTNQGETVLDNVAGSGTTAEACILENRNFIVMEKDPIHFQTMKQRIETILARPMLNLT